MQTPTLLRTVVLSILVLATLSVGQAQSIPAGCEACATTLNLPATPVSIAVTNNDTASPAATFGLVTGVVTGSPLNSALTNGTYQMWCGDSPDTPIRSAAFTPYSTYSPTLPSGSQNANWNKVNWILNNKQGTVGDVQEAIWIVLNGTGQNPNPSAITLSLVSNADPDFLPGPGQKQAVALYKDGIAAGSGFGVTQDLLVELPVPDCGAIGNFVWIDANGDGIQNDGPNSGINGVTLQLKTMSNVVVASTVTANSPGVGGEPGWYQFPIKLVGLSCSQWQVEVAGPIPTNYVATLSEQGTNRAIDSNASPAIVETSATRDGSGQTFDFGFKPTCTSAIGNYVFQDVNRNGIQDAGDLPIGNAVLQLKDSLGSPVGGTRTTNAAGYYRFSDLCGGTYTVTVVSGVPASFTPAQTGTGTPSTDSNSSPAAVVLPNDFNDETVDFGYVAPCSGAIGNLVWQDFNGNGIQDLGEAGIDGVLVTLMQGTTAECKGPDRFV